MTNKKLLLLINSLALTLPAHAGTEFNLGLGAQQLTLIETDRNTGQRLVKEQGWLPSVSYSLSAPIRNWQFNAQMQQSYGTIDYDGHTQPPANKPHQTESTHTLTQGMISGGWLIGPTTEIYTGFQVQEMIRDVANRDNVYGITETYDEVLWRLGAKQRLMADAQQQLVLWGEWQTPLYAHSSVELRINYDDTAITLKKGSAMAAGLHYQRQWSHKQSWFVDAAYYRHRYQDSSTATLTHQGQITGSYARQPPIAIQHLGIYGGFSWHWD